MPSLLGLALLCFALGALAALLTRRRGALMAGMAAALAGAVATPWASSLLQTSIPPLWAVLAGATSAALIAALITALWPRGSR